jgi:hypothetical protein
MLKPEVMTKPQPSPAAGGAFEADDEFERQVQPARGQGQPLPHAVRQDFETKLGADFLGVRVHADAPADSIQAQAFTTGQNLLFRQGAYEPASRGGQEQQARGAFSNMLQCKGPEQEELLQSKFDLLRHSSPADAELQMRASSVRAQLRTEALPDYNDTGLPDSLKSGIETLSGFSMDNVNVHYNSSQPARLSALAYAPGQRHSRRAGTGTASAHEAWHIVQQAQGRVQPTMQMKNGLTVIDDHTLEQEADVMGSKSLQLGQPKSVMTTISSTTARKLQEGDERSGTGTIIQPRVKKGSEGKVEWVDTTDLSGIPNPMKVTAQQRATCVVPFM